MDIREFIKNNVVLLDGAIATVLYGKGLDIKRRPETANITDPQTVYEIHKSYFDAGSNIICANTFGANRLYYEKSELEKIICASFDCAKRARDDSKADGEKYIALDLGSTGRLLQPYGDLGFDEAADVLSDTVRLGYKYGADLVFAETLTDGYETKAALLAVKETCNLPVFVSNAYSENGRLLTGAEPAALIAMLEGMGADAIGVNCSFGPQSLKPVIEEYLKYSSLPVIFKPNAGMPKNVNGKYVYDVDADQFADCVVSCVKDGVRIIGGCCGTTPEYIKALKERVSGVPLPALTDKGFTCVSSSTKAVFFSDKPILIGERINPTGKKRLKQAIVENDTGYIVEEGVKQQDAGAHILDVNVGVPGTDEAKMITNVMRQLQQTVDLPLQIDTGLPAAMERALRYYNGCALINSVNGKEESMKTVFPLMKKYGGVAVALTLDEDGIPDTAQKRFEIAKKILKTAKKYGIDRKNIVFDTLTMAVSTDPGSAETTLEALKLIKEKLKCHTVLGVSNISFGLPQRSVINAAFFTAALEAGLSAAIMNPFSSDMMKSYYSFKALHGLDRGFTGYISFASALTAETPAEKVCAPKSSGASDLTDAVIKGLKEQAEKLTDEALINRDPMEIVEKVLIPALDTVGKLYESGKTFLPQLLSSAEAAKCAFERIRLKAQNATAKNRGIFVIATVEGDVHDIGKNIVKLLLQNYGFDVIDLGKDVPADVIADKVVTLHAPFAGLSALMTTTLPAMEKTVALIHKKAPYCRVVVGGAVLTREYAEKIGADKYAKDAMETVRYATGE